MSTKPSGIKPENDKFSSGEWIWMIIAIVAIVSILLAELSVI